MSDRPVFRPIPCPSTKERAKTWAPYLSFSAGMSYRIVLASPKLLGLPLHYRNGRSILCREQIDHCPLCKEELPLWYGFSLALVLPSAEVYIVSFPELAYLSARKLVEGEGRLRGFILDVSRKEGKEQARLQVGVREEVYTKEMPALPDLRSCLARRYGVQLEWGS